MIVIREYDPATDREGAEAVERICEVGPSGEMSVLTDLLGDPLARVRHSPAYLMLVAETCGPAKEIVGLVRGCIKTVACGARRHRTAPPSPIYTKLAYVLGLRVAPSHRRMGIALKLVMKMEEWFKVRGAEYAYMATEKDNVASLRLFTQNCGYSKFRTLAVLVQPVHAHLLPTRPRRVSLFRIPPRDAEALYRCRLSTVEFFPRDIDSVLNNSLSLGTFLAVAETGYRWPGVDSFLVDPPESWAVLSVWNTNEVFRLEVKGVSKWTKALARTSRVFDKMFPWLKLPSVPDFFKPFGFYFLYGLGGEGERAAELVRVLCGHAHNMALSEKGCGLVVTEVAAGEPLRAGIPHWERLSWEEDVWCVKRLGGGEYSDGEFGDWTKAPPGPCIFVDPREV